MGTQGEPRRQSEKQIPHLVVQKDRVILQDHHHSREMRYIWETSDLTNSYAKVSTDFNNCEGQVSADMETACNNNRA